MGPYFCVDRIGTVLTGSYILTGVFFLLMELVPSRYFYVSCVGSWQYMYV